MADLVPIIVADLQSGRNGFEPPHSLSETEAVEMVNVDLYGATVARKRNGANTVSLANSSFNAPVQALHRHVPTSDDSAAELWGVDASTRIARLANGVVWSAITPVDALANSALATSFASLDGKLVMANQFAADTFGRYRLHAWDGSTLRRAGIAPSIVAPSVVNDANTGSYANTERFYRVRWVERAQLDTWDEALAVAAPAQQIILTANGTQHVSGFIAGPTTANVTVTVNANLAVTFYAAAGGGAGGASLPGGFWSGSGGGGGASNTSGMPVTLIAGKTYSYHVGAGGIGAGADGDETFLHNDTDAVYVFRFGGGKHGTTAPSAPNLGGNGGLVIVGSGVAGGNGGGVTGAATGGAGFSVTNGTGGGGAGGCDSFLGGNGGNGVANGGIGGGIRAFGASASGAGGGGGADALPDTVDGSGGGGGGGGAKFGYVGEALTGYGGGGGGGGGVNGGSGGDVGSGGDGVLVFNFTPTSFSNSLGGFNSSAGSGVWTPTTATDPSKFLVIGQKLLINAAVFIVTAVNSSTFSTAVHAEAYSAIAVQPAGSVVARRSEPSPSVSFKPSGSNTGALITHPFMPNDGETHWELEVSLDDATYYVLGTFPTTYPTVYDNAATSTYSSGDVSDITGTYNIPKPYKFVAADQNRLLGFGSWNGVDPQNRIEYSAVRGSLNIGDVERVPLGNFTELDENDSGEPTGLTGPVNGLFFAFKTNQVWALSATGDPLQPYAKTPISKKDGAYPRTIVVAEDESGMPALYWMSERGPRRIVINGFAQARVEDIGDGIRDYMDGTSGSFTHDAATLFYNHAVYHADKRQIWFHQYVSINGTNQYVRFVYNIGRVADSTPSDHPRQSGWTIHTGPSVQAYCSTMFSDVVGTDMGRLLKPYVGTISANTVLKCDSTATTDANTPFQAYVISREFQNWGFGHNATINHTYVLGRSTTNANATITVSLVGDYGNEQSSATITFTPTRSRQRVADVGLGSVGSAHLFIGDSAPTADAWQVDVCAAEVLPKELG